jgi:hypothetical protein
VERSGTLGIGHEEGRRALKGRRFKDREQLQQYDFGLIAKRTPQENLNWEYRGTS